MTAFKMFFQNYVTTRNSVWLQAPFCRLSRLCDGMLHGTLCVYKCCNGKRKLQSQALTLNCNFSVTRPASFRVNRAYHPYVNEQRISFTKYLVFSSVNTVLCNFCCSLNRNVYWIHLPLDTTMYPSSTEIHLMVDVS